MKEINEKHPHNEPFLQTNVLCSVNVATYRRPQLLQKLLQSLRQQILPVNVCLEIIVADNDLSKSAESVVRQFSDTHAVKFYYYTQPEKNISLTRNLTVEKSCGKYILFIDDDETASPYWVKHLLKTMKEYNADGVFGYVEPVFNDQTPEWMKRRDLFFYGDMKKTGTEAKAIYTNNCMLKASIFKKMVQPFDPSYGTSGGEDIHLFQKLSREGYRFVNCREAIVTEFLPADRTRMNYFFVRALSGGNRHARILIEASGWEKVFVRLFKLLKSINYGFVSLLLLIILFPNNVLRVKWLIKLGSNIGRFLAVFGWHYNIYKKI